MTRAHLLLGDHKVFIVNQLVELPHIGNEKNIYIVREADDKKNTIVYAWQEGQFRPLNIASNDGLHPLASFVLVDTLNELPEPADALYETLYIVLSDTDYSGKTTAYIRVVEDFVLLAIANNDALNQEFKQIEETVVTASVQVPHTTEIQMHTPENFIRNKPEVLKYVPEQINVTETLMSFNATDKSYFIENEHIIFDGSMKLRTLVELMMQSSIWSESGYLNRQMIERTAFKKIEKIWTSVAARSFIYHNGVYKRYFITEEIIGGDALVPNMNHQYTNGIVTISSSTPQVTTEGSRDSKVYNAFTLAASGYFRSNSRTGQIKVDFGVKKKINSFWMTSWNGPAAPMNFLLKGSNNNVNWTTVFTANDITWVTNGQSTQNFTIPTVNQGVYRYYMLDVTAIRSTVSNLIIKRMNFNGVTELATPGWETVSSALPALSRFQEVGMTDLSLLDRVGSTSPLDELSGPIELVTWNNAVSACYLMLTVVPFAQIIAPIKDMNIKSVDVIREIFMAHTVGNINNLKVAFSFDSGATWYTWQSGAFTIISLANISSQGVAPATITNIPSTAWNTLRGNSHSMRLAYYLNIENSTDRAEVDALRLRLDRYSRWQAMVRGRDYDCAYTDNDIAIFDLYKSGQFKINV